MIAPPHMLAAAPVLIGFGFAVGLLGRRRRRLLIDFLVFAWLLVGLPLFAMMVTP